MTGDRPAATEARLCESLASLLRLDRGAVVGETRLDDALKREQRRELWRQWESASGLKLPALDHALPVKLGWFAGGFFAALVALAALRTAGIHVPGSMIAGGVAGVVLGAAGLRLFGGPALEFPRGVRTVADLALRLERPEA